MPGEPAKSGASRRTRTASTSSSRGPRRDPRGTKETVMATKPVTEDGRARALADGNQMPMLGLGVWQVPNGAECVNAVRWALELGYRHIDTAQAYGNEESVGRGLRESGVPREQVFITTKFFPRSRSGDPARAIEKSLQRLGVDQVDLYLVHWPE